MLLIAHYYATRAAAQSVKQLVSWSRGHPVLQTRLQLDEGERSQVLDGASLAFSSSQISL